MTSPSASSSIRFAEVIGDPVAHSRSPFIHNFWLERLGLAGGNDYRAHRVAPDGLGGYFTGRRNDPFWRGCNITIPHKEAAYRLIVGEGGGALGHGEADFGAINTVRRDATTGLLTGHNTDVEGITGPLTGYGIGRDPLEIAIVGAGGAARAALWALRSLSESHRFRILVRREEQGRALLDEMGVKGAVLPISGQSLEGVQLIVNASPLGMTGKPPLALSLAAMDRANGVAFDMVYAPLETALLADARALGMVAIDGLQMLVGQAARAFELFFGARVPQELIAEVHQRLLSP